MLRRKVTLLAIAVGFPIGLIACIAPHGVVRTDESGRTYATTTEMLIEQGRQEQASQTAGIEPVANRLGGQVRVVLPSNQQLTWVIGTVLAALEKSELFDMVIIQEEADTRNPSIRGFDYLLWLDLQNRNRAQWYLRRAASARREPVHLDSDIDRSQVPRAWIDSIEQAGAALATKPQIAGTTQQAGNGSSGTQPAGGLQLSSSGSGFVVSPDGFVLTAHQVVDGCRRLVTEQKGQEVEMTLVRSDPPNDLALLKLPQHGSGVARFSDGESIDLRERVYAVGYPLRELLATSASVTDGEVTSLTGPGEDGRLLRMAAPVQPGTIGGPLLDRSGRIVGVVAGPLGTPGMVKKSRSPFPEYANFAIKGSLAERFLQESRVNYRTIGQKQNDAGAQPPTSNATIPIDCYKLGSGV